MKEVFGLFIDGETIYSTNPKFIAVEALAYMGIKMDFTEAIKAYEYNYEGEARSIQRQQELLESGEKVEFFRKFGPFKTAIGHVYRASFVHKARKRPYDEFLEMQFVHKKMTDEEFYRLPEYQ